MKKAGLLLVSLCCSLQSFWSLAQIVDLKKDYDEAVALYDGEKYQEALERFEKIIPQVEKVYEDTTSFYDMHNRLATCYMQLGKNDLAETWFMKTSKFYEGNRRLHENNFIALYNLASLYYETQKLESADLYFRKSLAWLKDTRQQKTPEYLALLQNLANVNTDLRRPKIADSTYQQTLALKREMYGESSLEAAYTYHQYAGFLRSHGRANEAEPHWHKAKKIIKDSLGPGHKLYPDILLNLGALYKSKQNYKEAEAVYQELAEVSRQKKSDRSEEYATAILNLALLYKTEGDYSQAEDYYYKALKLYRNLYGDKSPSYVQALMGLAGLYRNINQFSQAEEKYDECKKLLESGTGAKTIDYADLLNNMALLYHKTGRFDQAEKNFKASLDITRSLLGDKHPGYATSLDNLAQLYRDLGHYELSEPLYLQSSKIIKETLGEKHPEYGASLNNLASLYMNMGRFKEAEPLYAQAVQLFRNVFGEKHPEYALALNNQAGLYEETEQWEKAKVAYSQSLQIFRDAYGENHTDYATTLNNLALLQVKTGNFKEAEPLYKKDLEVVKARLGAKHPTYATSLANLAGLYENMARYPEAEKTHLQVLQIRAEALGEQHPDYAVTLNALARTYTAMGRYADAYGYWKRALANYKQEIDLFFPSMSEKEKAEFYNTIKGKFEEFNSFACQYYKTEPSILSEVYNNQLATKALLFNASNKVRERILNSGNAKIKELYKKWQNDNQLLAQQYLLPKNEIGYNLDSLKMVVNAEEKELSLLSESFRTENENAVKTWQMVQKELKEGEAAVELIRFRRYKADKGGTYVKFKYEGKEEMDSIYYAVLVVTPQTTSNPSMTLIKNGSELEGRYIKFYANVIKYKMEDKLCYDQFWKPIKEALPAGVKKVYLSPDKVYNQINLLTVSDPVTKKYVADEVEIQLVTNTKDLLERKSITYKGGAFFLGDPEYGADGAGKFKGGTLAPLPGTREEVKQISEVVKTQMPVIVCTGKVSTEDTLKKLNSPRLLHIATHGYFEKDVPQETSENKDAQSLPLLRSGLLLAGVSAAKRPGSEDGSLNAHEAMGLNLDQTELVVLSACETGLGVVTNGEGVYGLQRAFRVAGARTLIISLWKVNDETTQKLMTAFYNEWMKGVSKREAFKKAQESLRASFPQPYYWGAFIMIGD